MSLWASSNWIVACTCRARTCMLARTAVRKLSSNWAIVTPIVAACAAADSADRVARARANIASEVRLIAGKSKPPGTADAIGSGDTQRRYAAAIGGLGPLAENPCQSDGSRRNEIAVDPTAYGRGSSPGIASRRMCAHRPCGGSQGDRLLRRAAAGLRLAREATPRG